MPFSFDAQIIILAIAALLDYWIGDPWNWLHPVQVIGWCINRYTQFVLQHMHSPSAQRVMGVILGLLIIGGSGFAGWLIIWIATFIHPLVKMAIASILVASCFAGRSLRDAASDVLSPMQNNDLNAARSKLSLYVGRDTHNLDEPEVLRAVFETVTENAVDGVMAPLFYAILGAFTPMGSAPVALAYKAASTLDSSVGYYRKPYTHIGWFSARLEDGLTWLPCRLAVLTIALLSKKPRHVLALCQRDAPHDSSPNAGWSECAYAAALDVQVGGTNWYKGLAKHKPLLGNAVTSIGEIQIDRAIWFTRYSFLLWLGLSSIALSLSHHDLSRF
ncbi:MAG: adenosylcobinamide-phosphate synthase CbiB [Elainellaceae cyanobacterium]